MNQYINTSIHQYIKIHKNIVNKSGLRAAVGMPRDGGRAAGPAGTAAGVERRGGAARARAALKKRQVRSHRTGPHHFTSHHAQMRTRVVPEIPW